MNKINLLRLEIYQPSAHYRIPFSLNRKLTYPIPPYSTVIGFLCNACGVNDQEMEIYRIIKELKIAIVGRFAVKHTEYVWFRNLAKEYHVDYYGAENIRYKNGQVGHIGGIMPVRVDVLEDVELVIYLYHREINKLKEKLESLEDRLQPIHIGRSEDWIVIRDLELVDVYWKRVDGVYDYFFWIPERLFKKDTDGEDANDVRFDWEKIEGNIYYLTTLASVLDYELHYNHAGRKIYKRIKAKLSDGNIGNVFTYFDDEKKIPVFLGAME